MKLASFQNFCRPQASLSPSDSGPGLSSPILSQASTSTTRSHGSPGGLSRGGLNRTRRRSLPGPVAASDSEEEEEEEGGFSTGCFRLGA